MFSSRDQLYLFLDNMLLNLPGLPSSIYNRDPVTTIRVKAPAVFNEFCFPLTEIDYIPLTHVNITKTYSQTFTLALPAIVSSVSNYEVLRAIEALHKLRRRRRTPIGDPHLIATVRTLYDIG